MPLVRVAGTPEPDARPEFWQCWRQLGHAVVARAVYDYARAKRKAPKDGDNYDYSREMGYYQKFFRSKYFAYICPDYDGATLLEILDSGGWQKVRTMKHFGYRPTAKKEKVYIPKVNRDRRGRHCKYDYGGQHGEI